MEKGSSSIQTVSTTTANEASGTDLAKESSFLWMETITKDNGRTTNDMARELCSSLMASTSKGSSKGTRGMGLGSTIRSREKCSEISTSKALWKKGSYLRIPRKSSWRRPAVRFWRSGSAMGARWAKRWSRWKAKWWTSWYQPSAMARIGVIASTLWSDVRTREVFRSSLLSRGKACKGCMRYSRSQKKATRTTTPLSRLSWIRPQPTSTTSSSPRSSWRPRTSRWTSTPWFLRSPPSTAVPKKSSLLCRSARQQSSSSRTSLITTNSRIFERSPYHNGPSKTYLFSLTRLSCKTSLPFLPSRRLLERNFWTWAMTTWSQDLTCVWVRGKLSTPRWRRWKSSLAWWATRTKRSWSRAATHMVVILGWAGVMDIWLLLWSLPHWRLSKRRISSTWSKKSLSMII